MIKVFKMATVGAFCMWGLCVCTGGVPTTSPGWYRCRGQGQEDHRWVSSHVTMQLPSPASP